MPDPVCDEVDVVLADGVVAARVVVGRVLLAADHGRGVEEVLVGAGRDLVNDGGLEVDEDSPDGDKVQVLLNSGKLLRVHARGFADL